MTKRKPVEPVTLSLTVQKADGSGCDSYRLTAETLSLMFAHLAKLLEDAERNQFISARHSQQEATA